MAHAVTVPTDPAAQAPHKVNDHQNDQDYPERHVIPSLSVRPVRHRRTAARSKSYSRPGFHGEEYSVEAAAILSRRGGGDSGLLARAAISASASMTPN